MADDDLRRKCTDCGGIFPLSNFPVRKCNGRHYHQCKDCNRARARAWSRANPERNRSRVKRWRQADPSRHLANNQKWRDENREASRQYNREWHAAHPGYWIASKHKRRAAKRKAGGTYTAADIQELFTSQGGLCKYCACVLIKFDVEHMTPLSRGGTNGPENLCLACPKCNGEKRTKTADEFTAEFAVRKK